MLRIWSANFEELGRWFPSLRWRVGLCCLMGCFFAPWVWGASGEKAPQVSDGTSQVMQLNFRALMTAFRWSIRPEAFAQPDRGSAVGLALEQLAANAAFLDNHGRDLDEEYEFLKTSFARDTRDVLGAHRQGHASEARFIVDQMIDNCIGCHAKLPPKARFDPGPVFAQELDEMGLEAEERVRLLVATRQFQAALETYERMFRTPSIAPQQIDLLGAFQGYLEISIQVESDLARPQRVLRAFLERKDLPMYVASRVRAWVDALDSLAEVGVREVDLPRARQLIQRAQLESVFPEDPRGLVYYVVTASVLHRFIASKPSERDALAEAFYLLGVTESHLTHSYWLSETEFFLEHAIRLSPEAPFSKRAYQFLEELSTSGFTGSAGVNIPEDVQRRLKELRVLVSGT